MKVTIENTPLNDCLVVSTKVFSDERGFFMETWSKREFKEAGIDIDVVQGNHSRSQKNVLRGLHYQTMTTPLAKLVRCLRGSIYDVAVDLRTSSSTYGKWFGTKLSEENKKQLFVPVGFAHGYVTLSDVAEIEYKQTGYYNPEAERSIRWDDPLLAIAWPVKSPILSQKDKDGISFETYKSQPDFS